MDNRIPYDLSFLAKKLGATAPVDVEELVLQGFIEVSQDDSTPLASHKQSAMPETERETEAETEKKEPKGAARTLKVRPPRPPAPWMGRMRKAWTFGELLPGDATLLTPVVGAVGEDEAVERMENFCASADPEYATIRTFVAKHATYATKGRLAVDPATGLPNEIGMAALGGRR